MTNKQKFNQIDQTKLSDAQKGILSQIKDKTNNFTSKDKDLNAKISTSLDTIIAKLKEKTPEALKTTSKAPKRTAMGLAKDIRKTDESWNDALVRARKQMKADGESATKIMKSEIEKLKTFIKNHKELEGLRGTDLPRDSVRRAKPKGRRVSKDGNVYYEYRDNRTDRLAPNYPKGFPKLENGGLMDVHNGTQFMDTPLYANDGMMLGNSNGIEEDIDLSDDNKMRIKDMDYKYNRKSAREIAEKHNAAAFEYMNEDEKQFALGGQLLRFDIYGWENPSNRVQDGDDIIHVSSYEEAEEKAKEYLYKNNYKLVELYRKNMFVGSIKPNEDFKYSSRHKKYSYGGVFSNTFTGETGTHYTGLVGETNALSSGELFEDGGFMNGVYAENGAMIANQQLIKDATMNPAKMFANEGIPAYVPVYKRGGMMKYHEGGNLYQHGLDEGDTIVKSFGKYQKVKDSNGKIVFVNLATGMRTKIEPK